jgi:hypothetical protein
MFSFVTIKTSANEKYCLEPSKYDNSQKCFNSKEELDKYVKENEKEEKDRQQRQINRIERNIEEIPKRFWLNDLFGFIQFAMNFFTLILVVFLLDNPKKET